MDAMLAITGVAEIVLNVRDLPKMRDFYKEVLVGRHGIHSC
jgi:catechol-2,3-dioxygenase